MGFPRYALVAGLAAAGVGGAGCKALDPIDPAARCGNYVLDEGEDCDGISDPALGLGTQCAAPETYGECRYVWNDAAVCPSGWGAGGDGICRSASGNFAVDSTSVFSMAARSYDTGDVDGDGFADVVGYAHSMVSIRPSAPPGTSVPVTDFLAGMSGIAEPSLADLDHDGKYEVIMSSDEAFLVIQGKLGGEMSLVPLSSVDADKDVGGPKMLVPVRRGPARPWNDNMAIVPMTPTGIALVLADETGFITPLQVFAGLQYDRMKYVAADFDPPRDPENQITDVYFVDRGDTSSAESTITVVEADTLTERAEVDLGVPIADFLFADVDGDGHQDIVTEVVDPSGNTVAVAHGTAPDSFAPAVTDPRFDELLFDQTNPSQTTSRFPLAAADLDGDGDADFVGRYGIYRNDPAGFVRVRDRGFADAYREAVIADLNGDGTLDVAASGTTTKAIEVHLGNGMHGYNRIRIEIDRKAERLAAGDFDGNFAHDVVWFETLDDGGSEVFIAFSESGTGPSVGASMGRFDKVLQLEPTYLPAKTSDTWDPTDDLVLMTRSSTGHNWVAILFGGPTRRMQSPFVIRRGDQVHYMGIGQFNPPPSDTVDVFTLSDSYWSLVTGTDRGGFDADIPSRPIDTLDIQGDFEFTCSVGSPVDLDDDGRDEIVFLDHARHVGETACPGGGGTPNLLVLRIGGGLQAPVAGGTALPVNEGEVPLRVSPLNDRGMDLPPSILAEFEGLAVVYWNDGQGISPDRRTVIALPDGAEPLSATVINIDRDASPELAVVTTAGTYVLDVTEGEIGEAHRVADGAAAGTLFSGDLDRDGIEDLVLADGTTVRIITGIPENRRSVR